MSAEEGGGTARQVPQRPRWKLLGVRWHPRWSHKPAGGKIFKPVIGTCDFKTENMKRPGVLISNPGLRTLRCSPGVTGAGGAAQDPGEPRSSCCELGTTWPSRESSEKASAAWERGGTQRGPQKRPAAAQRQAPQEAAAKLGAPAPAFALATGRRGCEHASEGTQKAPERQRRDCGCRRACSQPSCGRGSWQLKNQQKRV